MSKKPTVLIVLDGWGCRKEGYGNAMKQANLPTFAYLYQNFPHAQLQAGGPAVGLPEGVMGNSNVGHLNMGTGRIIYQDLMRIDQDIAEGTLFNTPAYQTILAHAQKGGTVHLVGLLSEGGVHSHRRHLEALARPLHDAGAHLRLHAILDGRDTPPQVAARDLLWYEQQNLGPIATLSGRYYALDRDSRWQRVEKAYAAMAYGQGVAAPTAQAGLELAYKAGQNDEFVLPTVIGNSEPMRKEDLILFFNFRPDRARELSHAFYDESFVHFPTLGRLNLYTLTEYDAQLAAPVLVAPQEMGITVGEVVSDHHKTQLRIAETEKYAHVTYFFNGGREKPFVGEDRILIPSPKVATYDQLPAMSAVEVTDQVVAAIEKDAYDFMVLNYANADMVGHTGILSAAIEAVETVDACLDRVLKALGSKDGTALIVADHGNAETMLDATGNVVTSHSFTPVPAILVDYQRRGYGLRSGVLADVGPTVLQLMGLPIPSSMRQEGILV